MERGMIGLLVLSGVCHFASPLQQQHRPYHYHFINQPKTWPEAQQYCRQKYTDLATINDQQDLQSLVGLLQSQVSFVYVGLYRRWGWSLPDDGDYKNGELAYLNWAHDEPKLSVRYCGRIDADGKWYSINCKTKHYFSCFDENITDISRRFTLVENSVNWLTAQAHCRKWHTDLAKVRNQLENAELQKKISSKTLFGLEKGWFWSDGSEPSFIPWSPHEPPIDRTVARDCAVFSINNSSPGITESSCATPLPFFCSSGLVKKHLVRLVLTARDSVDMENNAVKTSILKWVEKKLGDKGVHTGVKLSWRRFSREKKNQTDTDEEVCAP